MSTGKLFLFFKVKIYFFVEGIKNLKYYLNPKFLFFDLCFLSVYFFINPYKVSRKFLTKKFGTKIYDYGETPLSTMNTIAKECNLTSTDTILELGAGRGKLSFWLHYFLKCKIIAIEQVPTFVKIANFFIKALKINNFEFLCTDMFNFDLNGYSAIYLYGTTLSDEKIKLLINKFKKLSCFVKIITISYSLDEYDKSFVIEKSFEVAFPWGKTKAYLNVKRS